MLQKQPSELALLCEEFRKNNHIEPAQFEQYQVKRGLRNPDGTGVMAGLTHICNVHGYLIADGEKIPDEGRLTYRGINVKDIVDGCTRENRFGYEEVAWLLLFGTQPTREQLEKVRLEDALKHPNWSMGHKITIDSSTMVNKGLEVMEARWLFGVEMDQVQVVVQPASIIHSMVEFEDGAVIAQLGTPDMKLPIQYALYYPERRFLPGDRLDFEKLTKISFEVPDMETFRGLKLAYEAGRRGGTLPTVFNAANEMAVAMFLERKINYLTIVDMIEGAMEHHCVKPSPDVAQILEAEQETYDYITSKWN